MKQQLRILCKSHIFYAGLLLCVVILLNSKTVNLYYKIYFPTYTNQVEHLSTQLKHQNIDNYNVIKFTESYSKPSNDISILNGEVILDQRKHGYISLQPYLLDNSKQFSFAFKFKNENCDSFCNVFWIGNESEPKRPAFSVYLHGEKKYLHIASFLGGYNTSPYVVKTDIWHSFIGSIDYEQGLLEFRIDDKIFTHRFPPNWGEINTFNIGLGGTPKQSYTGSLQLLTIWKSPLNKEKQKKVLHIYQAISVPEGLPLRKVSYFFIGLLAIFIGLLTILTLAKQKQHLLFIHSIGLLLLNLIIGVCIFFLVSPIVHLPSDDVAFSHDTQTVSTCLKLGYNISECLPKPNGFYTKPFFTIIAANLQNILSGFASINSLEAIALLSIFSFSSTIFLFGLLIYNQTKSHILVLLGSLLLYSSPFALGNTLWWGYSTLLTFMVLLFWLALWHVVRLMPVILQGRGAGRHSLGIFLFYYVSGLCLGVATFFIHVSALPFIGVGYIGAALALPYFADKSTEAQTYLIHLIQPKFFASIVLFFLHFLLGATLIYLLDLYTRQEFIEVTGESYISIYKSNFTMHLLKDGVGSFWRDLLHTFIFYLKLDWFFTIAASSILGHKVISTFLKHRDFIPQKSIDLKIKFLVFNALLALFAIFMSGAAMFIRLAFPSIMLIAFLVILTLLLWLQSAFSKPKSTKSQLGLISLVFFLIFIETGQIYQSKCVFDNSSKFERQLNESLEKPKYGKGKLYVEFSNFWDLYLREVSLSHLYSSEFLQNRFFGADDSYQVVFYTTPKSLLKELEHYGRKDAQSKLMMENIISYESHINSKIKNVIETRQSFLIQTKAGKLYLEESRVMLSPGEIKMLFKDLMETSNRAIAVFQRDDLRKIVKAEPNISILTRIPAEEFDLPSRNSFSLPLCARPNHIYGMNKSFMNQSAERFIAKFLPYLAKASNQDDSWINNLKAQKWYLY